MARNGGTAGRLILRVPLHFRAGAVIAACILATSYCAAAYTAELTKQFIREQRSLNVNGVQETWQLIWDGKPGTACGPDEVFMAITCPCSGWAYGEYGRLSLIRLRSGHKTERMDLRPLFGNFDYPEYDKVKGAAILQRWPMLADDFDREHRGDPSLVLDIKRRPASKIMQFADYDHDGQATELLVQVGEMPCGKLEFAAVGLSAENPHLHALASREHPKDPLMMPSDAWQALLKNSGPTRVTTLTCGDHGSDVWLDLVVSASGGLIHVREEEFSCVNDRAGQLIKETVW